MSIRALTAWAAALALVLAALAAALVPTRAAAWPGGGDTPQCVVEPCPLPTPSPTATTPRRWTTGR